MPRVTTGVCSGGMSIPMEVELSIYVECKTFCIANKKIYSESKNELYVLTLATMHRLSFTLPRKECLTLLVVGADTQKRLGNGEASFPAPSKACPLAWGQKCKRKITFNEKMFTSQTQRKCHRKPFFFSKLKKSEMKYVWNIIIFNWNAYHFDLDCVIFDCNCLGGLRIIIFVCNAKRFALHKKTQMLPS